MAKGEKKSVIMKIVFFNCQISNNSSYLFCSQKLLGRLGILVLIDPSKLTPEVHFHECCKLRVTGYYPCLAMHRDEVMHSIQPDQKDCCHSGIVLQ